ncbi:MAG TPA: hypothetical protein VMZ25_10170, partial [Terriglobales bacterium]|nr:hypothetical protein [Terriglobales bacterium]
MLTTLISILASLIPARYRGRLFHASNLDVQRGGLLSGILQIVLPAGYLWLRYPGWYQAYVAGIVDQVAAKGGDQTAQAAAALGAGTFALYTYLISPLTLLLIYLMLEGIVRLTAFVTSKEILPSLPLQLIAWVHGWSSHAARERELGPRMVDVVKAGPTGQFITIESCRPKQWDTLLTIAYMDKM